MILNIPSEPLNVASQMLFTIGSFRVTDTVLMSVVNIVFFLALIIMAQRFTVHNPSRFQIAVELIIEMISGLIKQISGQEHVAKKVAGFVISLVLFILVSNIILTFLPFMAAFTFDGKTMFRSYTNDINTTLALAVVSVIMTQIYSIQKNNIINYFFSFFALDLIVKGFSKGIKSGCMSIIDAFIKILDLVSEFAKVISLSLRLFGNMFAGELLIGVLMSIFAIALPLPIMGLSLLSGVIQAIVFGALVTSYFSNVLRD